jgi:hypothetical protein
MTTVDWNLRPASTAHACRTSWHAYIMVLLGFASWCSVLLRFFGGATEASSLAVLRPFCTKPSRLCPPTGFLRVGRYRANCYPLVELGLRTKGNDAAVD